jgi:hypothetical protein
MTHQKDEVVLGETGTGKQSGPHSCRLLEEAARLTVKSGKGKALSELARKGKANPGEKPEN